jgi:hypothetical protein
MKRARLVSATAALVLTALPLAALAAPTDEDTVNEQARDHHDNGTTLFKQHKYLECAGEFMAAYKIKANPDFLFNAGVCYEHLKDYDQAITLFNRYLSENPGAGDKKVVEDRIKRVTELKKGGTAKPAPKEDAGIRGVVVIDSKPPGATIYLDDKKNGPLGTTPWNGSISGEHTIILEAKGYKPDEEKFSGTDKMQILHIALSEQHYLGWVEVRANEVGADVYLDDKSSGAVGKTPYLANITPGKHTIIVAKEGYSEDKKDVDIEAGKAHKIEMKIEALPIGFIHVSGQAIEGGIVRVNGKEACKPAPCKLQAPEGDVEISVERPGYKTYKRKMTIVKGSLSELSVKLMPKEGHLDAIWNFVFAGVFFGGGIALGLHANSIHDDIQNDINKGMPPVVPGDDRFLKGKLFAAGADVAYLVGAITAVTGVISLLKEKGPPSTGTAEAKTIGIVPVVTPTYAGLVTEVRW